MQNNYQFFPTLQQQCGLFTFAPHLVIALPVLRLQKLSLLTYLLHFCISFVIGSWLLLYIDSQIDNKRCRSFTRLKAIAKSDNFRENNQGKKQRNDSK